MFGLCFLVGFFDILYLFVFLGGVVFVFLLGFFDFRFAGLFFCDSLTFFLLFLTIWLFLYCFLSSLLDKWGGNFYRDFIFFLGLIFFFLLIRFSCFRFFSFYVCFEFVFLLMFYFLVGWGYRPERVQASFYMVFYTLLVSFPFLIFLFFGRLGFFSGCFFFVSSFSSYWWVFLFLVFMVKLPVYGVHLWLPKAHVEAPVSGSILLAGLLLKLGGYGFVRFSFFLPYYVAGCRGYFVSFGLLGGVFRCLLCLRQVDMKSFVAYSSVCHMGLGLGGFFSGLDFGLKGGIYILIGHGYCSSCIFYILYVVYKRFHTRSILVLKGSLWLFSLLGYFWFLYCVLNIGVPPFFPFFSEVLILGGVSHSWFIFLFLFFLVFLLAGIYGVYLFVSIMHGSSLLDSSSFLLVLREFLIFFGHLIPLVYIVFVLGVFF